MTYPKNMDLDALPPPYLRVASWASFAGSHVLPEAGADANAWKMEKSEAYTPIPTPTTIPSPTRSSKVTVVKVKLS